jgi:murein DD-endopeptidase MepM/ murein hydrolase activator NlpD
VQSHTLATDGNAVKTGQVIGKVGTTGQLLLESTD